MAQTMLVSMEIRFRTTDDPEQLATRIEESLRMIVGRDALEDFRWRALPLGPARRRTGA